ncbi:unnamed protein product [Alopecurus aequalis]
MCFRFGSCFGSGSRQDYGRAASKATHHGYYSGPDLWSAPQTYHNQSAPPNDNAGGMLKDHFDDAGTGHGGYYVQDKAGGEAPKQPAVWSGKVDGDAADYTHTYMARLHEAAAGHQREKASADYHRYPATTTTTLVRY